MPEPDFAALHADVRPLKDSQRAYPARPAPPHWPRRAGTEPSSGALPDAAIVQQMSGWLDRGDEPDTHLASGVARATLKRLVAGHFPVVATLDLHGMDRYAAHGALALFLHRARSRGACVRVVHGMGYGSRGEPVLPRMVRRWLACHPHVLAFTPAPAASGGQGALLVLLRRAAPPSTDYA
ncbi:Smr/MutS family protein [Crenobacter intestini]|uniref:Smr/MutS family protein n=1 Tax=Crenobacter intestini TaxID=2563443 RepID=UPI001F2F1423|nr:Smr/MutS family protein [Crenobacter intestini]